MFNKSGLTSSQIRSLATALTQAADAQEKIEQQFNDALAQINAGTKALRALGIK